MKASLVVIASLFVSPAHAFENLIIDSIFHYPVELIDKATSWSDVQLAGPTQGTNAAAQRQNSKKLRKLVIRSEIVTGLSGFVIPEVCYRANDLQ